MMSVKKLVLPIGLAVLIGCSLVSPEEQAAMAAKGYYTHLMAGQYESFLEGKYGSDTLPADYRE